MKNVFFVTGNQGKLREVQRCLTPECGVALTAVNLDLPEVQDSSAVEISRKKAIEAFHRVKEERGSEQAVLIEDTSLSFDALNGLPGPYIKWFLQSIGCEGLTRMLSGFKVEGSDDYRKATARCIFSYCDGTDPATGELRIIQFIGECHGHITLTPQGSNGFGWDGIFAPSVDGSAAATRTFAEMTIDEKNLISHRSKAMAQLTEYFRSHSAASS